MPRITKKVFIKMLNEKFSQLEIKEYRVIDLYATRFRSDDYEAGAAKMVAVFKSIDSNETGQFYCSYSLKEYEKYFKNGYKLVFRFKDQFQLLTDIDPDVMR